MIKNPSSGRFLPYAHLKISIQHRPGRAGKIGTNYLFSIFNKKKVVNYYIKYILHFINI